MFPRLCIEAPLDLQEILRIDPNPDPALQRLAFSPIRSIRITDARSDFLTDNASALRIVSPSDGADFMTYPEPITPSSIMPESRAGKMIKRDWPMGLLVVTNGVFREEKLAHQFG
ncbi:MAG: hypothetical protein AAGA38_17210 [Pseudomonadota bacterium]